MTNENRVETRGQNHPAIQPLADAGQFVCGVFDSSIFGLAILDNRLRYLTVNNAMASIDGMSVEQHQGKTVPEVLGHAVLVVESALDRVLTTGEHTTSLEVTATLPTRDAPGHFRMNLFPIKDASGAVAEIVILIVEITKLREFETCLIDLIGHLPRVRDQIVCLGLPNRAENDKIQSWRRSIEMLDACVQQIHRLSEMLRPPALLLTIADFGPHQVSLPFSSPTTSKENGQQPSSQLPEQENKTTLLSPRLRETAQYLAQGKSNKEIASTLGISVRTVDHYREAIMLKLDIHSLTELVRYAVRNKLISL